MTSKTYAVSYLQQLSTLADRFYSMIYDLSKREKSEMFYNPGASLRSYLIAFCARDDIVEVEGRMNEIIGECHDFQSDPRILTRINESLYTSATELITSVNTMSHSHRIDMLDKITELQQASTLVRATYEAFMSIQDPAKDFVDLTTSAAISYKKAIFDMQDTIEELAFQISTRAN